MKRTNQNQAKSAAPNFALAIDAETLNELCDLLDQRKKLDDATSSAPAEIAAAERELAAMRHQLGILEADIVLIDDSKLPGLEKEVAKLSSAIDAKDLTFRRLKGRLEALEARAPELDSKIEISIGYVRVEANMAVENLQEELAADLREKVSAIRNIYAQVRELNRCAAHQQTRDFLACAHVPDLRHCMVSYGNGAPHDISQNLLALRDDETATAESTIVEAIKPITEALALARAHRPYVPFAKRPVPYIRKGAFDGPGGRVDRPEDSQPEEEPPKLKTMEEAMAEPYTVKGDANGIRTWKNLPPADLNVGQAILQTSDSGNR